MKITPPANVKITEWPASVMWTDDSGILVSVTRKVNGRTFEEMKKTMDDFKHSLNDKKICMLVDVTEMSEYPRDTRDYAAAEFPKYLKAVALVSDSALGRMMANLFFTLKKQPYPTKLFDSEQEARAWLMNYL